MLTRFIDSQVLPDVKDELDEAIKDCRLALNQAVAVIDDDYIPVPPIVPTGVNDYTIIGGVNGVPQVTIDVDDPHIC